MVSAFWIFGSIIPRSLENTIQTIMMEVTWLLLLAGVVLLEWRSPVSFHLTVRGNQMRASSYALRLRDGRSMNTSCSVKNLWLSYT